MTTIAQDAPPFDTDLLPIPQYLVMELLGARYRTGEQSWTFPRRLRRSLEALAELGLITFESAGSKHLRAELTEAGLAAAIIPTFLTPDQKEVARLNDKVARLDIVVEDLLDRMPRRAAAIAQPNTKES